MRAMLLRELGSLDSNPAPLHLAEVDDPAPADNEVLVEIAACGVCHTELDEIEGRTPPPVLPIIPGHEVVGRVAETGKGCTRFSPGDRVGVGWIHSSDGTEAENISADFRATGRDRNGGYAEYMTVPEDYAYPIPDCFGDAEAAPLMCAGAVGYRSFRLTMLENGEVLGLTGFGGSGHLVLQLCKHLCPDSPVFVFARSGVERDFAIELGADWSGDTGDVPPERPRAIVDTTPAWKPVLAALERLRPGGRLVINAIRKRDDDRDLLAGIRYEEHLWMEKELKTVANVTRRDIAEFLPIAAEIPLHVQIECFPLAAANDALRALGKGDIRGSKVLLIGNKNKEL